MSGERSLGKLAKQRLRDGRDLSNGHVDADALLKIDPDDRNAVYDRDSMCSMSFTVVVNARSHCVTMRVDMSSGEIPL